MQNINGKMEPEIGYHINREHTNKGYATEAAIACRNYAFTILKLKKLFSYMKYTNIALARVAEKNGMKLIMEIEDQKNIRTKVYAITLEDGLLPEQPHGFPASSGDCDSLGFRPGS
jgi:RimJ/RimL family protein N-acetyltransferase